MKVLADDVDRSGPSETRLLILDSVVYSMRAWQILEEEILLGRLGIEVWDRSLGS